jgi:crotonobetainyl-CoA:carnitine CoA-transferase CaiB-like acyl-CoA transferase
MLATGFIYEAEHPTEGKIRTTGSPVKWGNHPKTTHSAKPSPAPLLGQHTREVLSGLGYSDATIERMMTEASKK